MILSTFLLIYRVTVILRGLSFVRKFKDDTGYDNFLISDF